MNERIRLLAGKRLRAAATRAWVPRLVFVGLLVLGCFLAPPLPAQTRQLGKIKDWKIFDFYEVGTAERGGTNRLKTLLSGAMAEPGPDNKVEVSQMWMGNFDRDGSTNLVATSPQCTVDTKERVATSPGPVLIQTGLGQLSIQGTGFQCSLTNSVLHISNAVETVIRRELIGSSGLTAERLATLNTVPGVEGGQTPSTNAPIRITSDRFLFHQGSNFALYSDHVLVEDPRLALTCQQLIIHFSTNGALQQIVATHDVLLRDKASQAQASGEQAVYRLADASEQVELTGTPARWKEGPREGSGPRFVFDPHQNNLIAPEQSLVRLPRADFTQPGFLTGGPRGTNAPPDNDTNQVLEITALTMEAHLPSTNQPARTVLASNQVVIVSAADQSRASGQRAFYSDTTGVLELTGSARWESEGRVLTGDGFFFDRTNQVFRAEPNAYVKLPLSSLASNALVSQLFVSSTNPGSATDQSLEAFADRLLFRPGQLQLLDRVRVVLQQGNEVLGRLFCGQLTLHLGSNQLERVVAQDQVVMEQPASLTNPSNRVEKRLTCEWFTAFLGTNGHVRQLVAETNVLIRQTEYPLDSAPPIQTDLRADSVTAWFAEHTNELDRIVADKHVRIEQVAGRARGNRAVYSRTDDTLVLSGEVVLETPTGLLNAPAAVLRHFGLWPGRLGQLGMVLRRSRNVAPQSPSSSSSAQEARPP